MTPFPRPFSSVIISLAVWAALCPMGLAEPVQLKFTDLKVDGVSMRALGKDLNSAGVPELELPHRSEKLEVGISVVTRRSEVRQLYRLRHKLDGVDAEWRDPTPAYMFVAIQVVDEKMRPFAEERLEYRGDSPGWQGNLQDSQFTPYRLEFKMPAGAVKARVTAYSNGGRSALGILALKKITMTTGTLGTASFRRAEFPLDVPPDSGPLRMKPPPQDSQFSGPTVETILPKWDRAHLDKVLPRLVRLEKPEPHNVLIIEDVMGDGSGLWRITDAHCVPVTPGETVVAEWEACYALGGGTPATVSYDRLSSGRYWLRVAPFGLDGSRVGEEISVPIRVLPPFWGRLWFLLTAGAAFTVLAVWGTLRFTQQRMARALELAEHQRAMEQERTRIARDLHDGLGTVLTRVFMLSETARKHPGDAERTAADLKAISGTIQEATHAMQEIVWAANAAYDSPDELATHISGTAQRVLDAAGVRCRLDLPVFLPPGKLSADTRHNISLAFHEALNNAIRHGHPEEIRITMTHQAGSLELLIEDNGGGFCPPTLGGRAAPRPGHGLDNMRHRMERIGGGFSVESEPGRGTRVRLTFPWNPGDPPRSEPVSPKWAT